MIYFITF